MKTFNIGDLFSKYGQALNLLIGKLNAFNDNCLKLGEENPIEHIKYRLKAEESIKNKLRDKLNLDFTIENFENLNDVVGVRIVCTFLNDMTKVIDFIKNDLGYEILDIRDYITNPKENGYSSYHIIIAIPVLIEGNTEIVKAEIQVRSMAMDVLSSQSHKIMYKQNYDKDSNIYTDVIEELEDTRKFVNEFDKELDVLYKKNKLNNQNEELDIPEFCTAEELESFLEKYKLALEVFNDTFLADITNDYYYNGVECPIEHVKWRIKPLEKIVSKLKSKGHELTFQNLETYINDIGAIKLVCSFLDDTNDLIEKINNYHGFKILEREDFINNPKESGYRSYHFTVGVPVEIDNEITYVKIEIQVRTIMMDFWANVEHKMCFKKEVRKDIKEEFVRMSNILWEKELRMNELSKLSKDRKNNLRRERVINN